MKSGPYIHMIAVHAYQKPPMIMPKMEDLMTKLFWSSTLPKNSGLGPRPRADREYRPRQEPMIRPFITPRQPTAMNAYTMVPMTPPKILEKAMRGRDSPSGQVPMMVGTSPTQLMAKMYTQ